MTITVVVKPRSIYTSFIKFKIQNLKMDGDKLLPHQEKMLFLMKDCIKATGNTAGLVLDRSTQVSGLAFGLWCM